MQPLSVLYRDEHYVAVDKPSGLLVHRTALAAGAADAALQRIRNQLGQRVYTVHRLDRGTSGVLVFGLSPEAAKRLFDAFMARRVHKTYIAVVRGHTEPEGFIDYPLRDADTGASQPAQTAYRRLATVELPIPVGRYPCARYALVAARPVTGRLHQIRRHFAHIRHPVVGDTTHGEGRHNRLFREHFGVRRLLLMATGLRFAHPYTASEVDIRAPLPAEVAGLFRALGWAAFAPPPAPQEARS